MGELTSFDQWYNDLHDICGHYDGIARRHQHDVLGSVKLRNYHRLDVADVSGNVDSIKRDRNGIRRDQSEYVFFIVQASGQMGVEHNGHNSILNPGDGVLLDSTKEGHLALQEAGGRLLSVHLPRQVFLSNCDGKVRFGSRLAVNHPLSLALRMQFAGHLNGSEDGSTRKASTNLLFDMVRLAFASTDDTVDANRLSSEEDQFDYAMQIVGSNLMSETLSLQWVAHQMRLSIRQLQRVFRAHNTTYTRVVREKRLKFVAEQLRLEPVENKIKIADLAYQAGFCDISNFNREFRDFFGTSPRSYRREFG